MDEVSQSLAIAPYELRLLQIRVAIKTHDAKDVSINSIEAISTQCIVRGLVRCYLTVAYVLQR